MGKANQTKQTSSKAQPVAVKNAIDQYLTRDDISADVLQILVDRESASQQAEFESAKSAIELGEIKKSYEREAKLLQAKDAQAVSEQKQQQAYRHDMLEFKRNSKPLVTKNVVEKQIVGPVAIGTPTEKYLYPNYNEVKGYINENASSFGFNFEVNSVKNKDGKHDVNVLVSHENGAVRTFTTEIDVRYNQHDSVQITHQKAVSTAAKALLMGAFGIHYVAGDNVPDDVICDDEGGHSVQPLDYKAKDDVKSVKTEDGLTDEQVNVINRSINSAGLSYDTIFKQLTLSGSKTASIDDIKSSDFEKVLDIINQTKERKNKHKAK